MSERARRLAAVWFADIAGYTDLSARDEDTALRLVELLQSIAGDVVGEHGGRLVKFMGDAVLAEFQSTDRAVRAALDVRDRFAGRARSAGLGSHDLRVGAHVGEVVTSDDGDLYGDGVNAASRLQGSAAPGEVRVSEDVWRQLRQRPGFGFEPHGEHTLKGLASPMELYSVRLKGAVPPVGQSSRGVAAGTFPKRAIPARSIAVLPFVNLSRDPDNEYFSDGITETLLMTLTKLGDLKVISRTSVMTYKGSDKKVRQIGEELGVATVLEGSVQRVGQRVRITAQLIEAETDAHLWAETYDRNLEDIFAIQSEVAEQIATSLKSALTPAEKARIDSRPTESVMAYQQFLKGRYFLARRTEEAIRQAIEQFRQAVEADPSFAQAWAGLADGYALLPSYSNAPAVEASAEARGAAQRALALDPALGEAHAALGLVAQNDWNWAEAEREYRRAIELSPGYSTAYHWYGNLLSDLSRDDEAISTLEYALELDPLSLPVHMGLGVACMYAGRFERAQEIYQKAIDIEPRYLAAHANMASLHLQCGRFEAAIDALEIVAKLSNFLYTPDLMDELRSAYEAGGPAGFWEATLEGLMSQEDVPHALDYSVEACAQLGRPDQAFAILDRMVAERLAGMVKVHRDRLFDPLRSDPRFDAMLRRLGVE